MLSDGSRFGKKVIIFGAGKSVMFCADMSLFVHVNDRKKYILVLGKRLTERLGDTLWTAEK